MASKVLRTASRVSRGTNEASTVCQRASFAGAREAIRNYALLSMRKNAYIGLEVKNG
jgi:hypothetical protein